MISKEKSKELPKDSSSASSPSEEPIDDSFWYTLSKDWVKNAIPTLDADSAKLQTILGWLWGVYTAGASIGIALSKLSYPLYINVLIGLPSVVLIIGYWLAGWAQMPLGSLRKDEPASKDKYKFDPKSAQEIDEVYKETVKAKRGRLYWVLSTSGLASVLVAAALITASFSHQTYIPEFQAMISTQNGQDTIGLTGHLPADTQIIVRVAVPSGTGESRVLKELPYMTSSTGDVQANIQMDSTAQKYIVTLEWKVKDGTVSTLQKNITP